MTATIEAGRSSTAVDAGPDRRPPRSDGDVAVPGLGRRVVLRFVQSWVPVLAAIAAVIGLWQLASTLGWVKDFVLPGPWAVARAFVEKRSLLLEHAIPTTRFAIIGFLIGNSIAVLLAVLFIHSQIAERALFPMAVALKSVPFIALTPVLVLWLGNGGEARIFVIAFGQFFPTLVNMMRGLRSVDREARELMHSYSANWWQVLTKLRWKASMPFLFAALRIGAGGCFISALVAEWIGADRGLGYLVLTSSYQFRTATLWAAVFTASGLALGAFGLVALVERRTLRWAKHGAVLPE